MLSVDLLELRFAKHRILNDIRLNLDAGNLVVIVGQNGSGKSSLLRCISGWNRLIKGSILLENRSIHDLSPRERASWVSFLPQRPRLSESLPVLDIIAAARYRFSESNSQSKTYASRLLQQKNIEHLAHRDWKTLSGGEAQRVALACMQAQDAKIWLLDEPANHLDPAVQKEMYQHLIEEWQQGRTLIVVTHNINLILGSVSPESYPLVRIVGLQEGTTFFESDLSDGTLTESIGHLYKLPVEKVSVFGRDHLIFGTPT
ncbi:MAG: ABC transporter ATP-binding protein [Myxococcota bacterium]|nr:ABC transporter ATP-binding protein [Myxococcota bacterium]